MSAELVAYSLAVIGVLALAGAFVGQLRGQKRSAEAAERALAHERERYHDLVAMVDEIGVVVAEATQRAEDKLHALERVLKHAEKRAERLQELAEHAGQR
jgi:uncharacterized protein HemX